ncbi:amino acid transporter [Catellatospora sp. TT07R-123]|uniref:APC family permease n=1 Tax=Catellatospora sp. TT07R-123 TaxID=2733863 RepID=UPI001B1F5418|nr:APC family permease [Catellatospora sp. TT07R-123]GHJ49636.1 amino acid transporter [Catellatospora sp. TT07R-123]
MASPTSLLKRLLLGRPFRSDRLQHTLLPKRIALPIFASDALSSVAYAPGEILLTLSVAGAAAYAYSPWVALAVVVVMLTVVASYRQNVHAYPSGGGDYEVATVNLGPKAGLGVASALLVDYVLTVAVSISSGVDSLGDAIPLIGQHKVITAVVLIAVLAALNLRGLKESGLLFAIPTYLFMFSIVGLVGWGLFRILVLGQDLKASSAGLTILPEHGMSVATSFAFAFLLVRAFSSGCAALTGVEAISNGVPAFKAPKSKNAATTLLLLGTISIAMMLGIVALSLMTGLQYVESPKDQIVGATANYKQPTVIAQLAEVVFNHFPPGFYLVIAVTALILVLAANTAFNGFPVLGSILAQDRYLPRQLHTRGDRLAFSNGIMFLAAFAAVLVVAFQAQTTRLIQLYIVGVFVSFTLSQIGMLRHWNRLLRTERDPVARRRMNRSKAINGFGAVMTGFVLILVLLTKFTHGAWISLAAMAVIYAVMLAIRKHYDTVARELVPSEERPVLPARNHAVVLVSKVHLPTMRALAYAKATRPDTLTALTVNVDTADTRAIQAEWDRRGISVPLTVVDSPYREISRPIIDYVKSLRRESPRDVVTVFIPEYVVGRWWEHLLHNQSALRIKGRLLYESGVMVVSVPWQLDSTSATNLDRLDRSLARTPARGPRPGEDGYVKTHD